jgi:hypothetical protein
MKKISKLLMLAVIALFGVVILASCGYKGKKFEYESSKISESLQKRIDALNDQYGTSITSDEFVNQFASAMFSVGFSKDGKEVTLYASESDLLPVDLSQGVTYPILKEKNNLFADENKNGVIDDSERYQSFKIKGSKLILRMDLNHNFEEFEGDFWVEITFKKI